MILLLDDNIVFVKSGVCEIISNETFSVETFKTRTGTDEDVKDLKEVFEWLQFKVNVNENLTYKEMNDLLHSYSTKDYSDCDTVICFIMSHGTDDQIYTTDGSLISSDTIRSVFIKNNQLLNKPKCVFVQACRGSDKTNISQSDGNLSEEPYQYTKYPESVRNKDNSITPRKADLAFVDGSEIICQDQDFMMLFSGTTGKYSESLSCSFI